MSEDIYRLMATWWKGLNLSYKGVSLGDCLSYDLSQLLTRRREVEAMEHDAMSDDAQQPK